MKYIFIFIPALSLSIHEIHEYCVPGPILLSRYYPFPEYLLSKQEMNHLIDFAVNVMFSGIWSRSNHFRNSHLLKSSRDLDNQTISSWIGLVMSVDPGENRLQNLFGAVSHLPWRERLNFRVAIIKTLFCIDKILVKIFEILYRLTVQ